MFWKNVNNHLKNVVELYTRRSITLRLTLLFALSTLIALLGSSIYLYNLLVNDLYSSDLKIIDTEIRLLKQVLLSHRDQVITLDPQSAEKKTYYLRVIDPAGNTLLETPDMNEEFESSDFPIPPADNSMSPAHSIKSNSGRYYLVQTSLVTLPGKEDTKILEIQMALDTNQHHELIMKYRLRLLAIVTFGLLFSTVFGALIAYKGMKPLREVTKIIERITATHLNEQMNPSDWPFELTRLVEAFEQMLERLDNSFSQLKRFSEDIAHELRTPIHHLMVETEITLSQTRSLQEYQDTLQSSLEEYSRLGQLIDRLLFLARAENPRTEIKKTNLLLSQEFASLFEFFDAACEEKNIQFQTEGDGEIYVEPILFRRAITNLISNAIKYTPKDGKIKLIATETEQYNVIHVIDSGSGIDKTHLPYLFDRFYRVDYSRTKSQGGHGLGLAIVKSILEMHQGKVTVSSELGHGSTFSLYFPKAPQLDK